MSERLVSGGLRPVADAGFLGTPRVGEPGLPSAFQWGKRALVLREVLDQWKESGPCSSGGGERYVRKHWFRVRTVDDAVLTLYFERQAKTSVKRRWWLYTIDEETGEIPCDPV
jgi:hypothetical protein